MDHMLGHQTSLNKFKKIESLSSIFSDYSSMKLEITRIGGKKKKHKHMEPKHVTN